MIKYDAIDQDVSDCGSFIILCSCKDVANYEMQKTHPSLIVLINVDPLSIANLV